LLAQNSRALSDNRISSLPWVQNCRAASRADSQTSDVFAAACGSMNSLGGTCPSPAGAYSIRPFAYHVAGPGRKSAQDSFRFLEVTRRISIFSLIFRTKSKVCISSCIDISEFPSTYRVGFSRCFIMRSSHRGSWSTRTGSSFNRSEWSAEMCRTSGILNSQFSGGSKFPTFRRNPDARWRGKSPFSRNVRTRQETIIRIQTNDCRYTSTHPFKKRLHSTRGLPANWRA